MSRWPNREQKRIVFERLGYEPHPEQAAVHSSAAEVLQVVGAEGGGKSFVTAAEVTACVPWCELIYLVGEAYNNARPEFENLADNLQGLGLLDGSKVRIDALGVGKGVMVTETVCSRVINKPGKDMGTDMRYKSASWTSIID